MFNLVGCSTNSAPTIQDDARNQIVDATVCTKQPGFAYNNCELKVTNNSGKEIIATLKWTGLGLQQPFDKVVTNQTLPANSTTSLAVAWAIVRPNGFHIIEARYK